MPAWLTRHLEQTATTMGGVGTNLRPRTCKGCGARVVVAMTPERLADRYELDPLALSPLGELQALLAGRRTVDTMPRGEGRVEVYTRRPAHIAARPPGSGRGAVLAEHRCGSPPLDLEPPRPGDSHLPPNSPPPF